jgi:outer membrane biosynthesis protein TonB
MRILARISTLVAVAALAGACASASAKVKPIEVPPLVMPPPPPRVIEPVPPPEPAPAPVADLPAAPPANRPVRPQPKEREQPKPPETKPPESQPVQPEMPAPVPQPPPQLRTPATANDTAAESQIRGAVERGRSLLASVNFGMLSNERKKAYEDAKMLLDQAESALKQGNYGFAQGVASKGETLAHDLAGK